jgi:hypothetical protein
VAGCGGSGGRWNLLGPGQQGGPGGRWSAVGPLLSFDRWCLDDAAEAFGPGRCRAQDGGGGAVPVLSCSVGRSGKGGGVPNPAPSMTMSAMA